MSATAKLAADGGMSASSADFFRSPEFLKAEGATHTVSIEGDGRSLRLPVIVREIPGSERLDAISPYGYPGAREAPDPPPDPDAVDWTPTGLVSLFVRDRVGPPSLARATRRSELQIADPGLEPRIRRRLAEQIAQNRRRGWTTDVFPGGAGLERAPIEAFEAAYAETMDRVEAAERYRFSGGYFERVFAAESAFLVTASRAPQVGAAAIMVESDGYLHYFLGGTCGWALADSPMKNVFAAMIAEAAERGLPLSLGGGIRPGDSLERFKRGFANRTEPFRTHEIVCDPGAYDELGAGRPAGSFFPAYRAP